MDLICVDGQFTNAQKKIIPYRPVQGKIYQFRELVQVNVNGTFKPAIRVVELVNPLLNDPKTGMMFEPSFKIERWATLEQEPLTKAMLSNIKKLVT